MSATCSYCLICGHEPKTSKDEPNYVRRFWCADDGWKVGALCSSCWEDAQHDRPKPTDYAYDATNGVCDHEETDEDVTDYI